MRTPIYISFDHSLSPLRERVVADPVTEPTYGDYQYYLVIHAPDTFNEIGALPLEKTTVNIPAAGPLENKLRLSLLPSIGYGVSSSYSVEYFRWRRTFLPSGAERKKIVPEKVRQEYWYVPYITGEFIPNYHSYLHKKDSHFPLSTRLLSVPISRGSGSTDSLNEHPQVIHITEIYQGTNKLTDWRLVDDSLYIPNGTASIQWGSNGPAADSEYRVRYIKPFEHEDVLFIPSQDQGVLPGNFNLWNYPNRI